MIEFQTEGVEMPLLDEGRIFRWVDAIVVGYGRRLGNIVYRFTNDEGILTANREFLGHDYFTDIITFDYCRGNRVEGDILISLDTVRSNAASLGEPYQRELLRVLAHGVLHLCGINDKGPGEREVMEAEENKALALYDETPR